MLEEESERILDLLEHTPFRGKISKRWYCYFDEGSLYSSQIWQRYNVGRITFKWLGQILGAGATVMFFRGTKPSENIYVLLMVVRKLALHV